MRRAGLILFCCRTINKIVLYYTWYWREAIQQFSKNFFHDCTEAIDNSMYLCIAFKGKIITRARRVDLSRKRNVYKHYCNINSNRICTVSSSKTKQIWIIYVTCIYFICLYITIIYLYINAIDHFVCITINYFNLIKIAYRERVVQKGLSLQYFTNRMSLYTRKW